MEADGRAADEAAARRTMTGLPFSECESGRLRKAPNPEPKAFGLEEPDQAGHRTQVQDQPGRRRDFGSRAATGGKGASAPDMSGRTGFRPGSCEAARTQDASPWTCQVEEKLRLRIPPDAEPEAPAEGTARDGKRNFGSESAKRRTARASALTGSPRGNLKELRLRTDPGGDGAGTSVQVSVPRNRPARMPRLPGRV